MVSKTDFDFSDIRGGGQSTSCNQATLNCFYTLTSTANARADWFGTVRARLGYLPSNNLLVYATGGFAYGQVTENATYFSNGLIAYTANNGTCYPLTICYAGTGRETRPGWTVGGGLEYALWNNWVVRAEYLYVNLGGTTFNETVLAPSIAPPITATASYAVHSGDFALSIVRGGISYQFH